MHEDLEKELSKQTALAQNGQIAIDTNMRLSEVIVDLQSCYKEAMELLEADISNINKLSVCECCEKGCQGDSVCIDNGYMYFSWRHADRYEALKQQSHYTPH